MDSDTQLWIRAGETMFLFVVFFSGAGLLFNLARRENGTTLAMAFTSLMTALYLSVIIFLSFVDLIRHPEWRLPTLYAFNLIGAGWIMAALWLGYKIFLQRQK